MRAEKASGTEAGSFHGLFIGIGNFGTPHIRNLQYATSDAEVLHALLTENLGAATLLLDSAATKDKIQTELRQLAEVSTPEDLVFVTYSGHGTHTGELVVHGCDVDNLSGTAYPMESFVSDVLRIPAKQCIVVLDCCFSGAAGSKVLRSDGQARGSVDSIVSTENWLRRFEGNGRILITAAGVQEQAWEIDQLRHGLLTFYLVKALMGEGAVRSDGRIEVAKLAPFLQDRVAHESRRHHKPTQTPSIYYAAEDRLLLKLLRPGARFTELWKHATPKPDATETLETLTPHGIPQSVLDRWREEGIEELNPLQLEAINDAGVTVGRTVLASAPTTSGKTLIAELAALSAIDRGRKAVFLLPTRALVNEQYAHFRRLYEPAGLQVVRAAGSMNNHVGQMLEGRFELAVLTYEKFISLALRDPGLLRFVGTIVLDEMQILGEPDRGPLVELFLTMLRRRHEREPGPQIIGLSAVLGEDHGLDEWLSAAAVSTTNRVVPLHEGVLTTTGRFRFIHRDSGAADGIEDYDDLLPQAEGFEELLPRLIGTLVADGEKVIVFRNSREKAQVTAEELANVLNLPRAEHALAALSNSESSQSLDRLRRCLSGGVAFHIAPLSDADKLAIEKSFRDEDANEVRVLVSTTTLAQGVNLPADTVVICELDRRTNGGDTRYSVAEYKNIAGRAGRKGQRESGRSIILASEHEAQRRFEQYVGADVDGIRSALLRGRRDLRDVVLSAYANIPTAGALGTENGLLEFLSWTLAASQSRTLHEPDPFSAEEVGAAVQTLVQHRLLARQESGFELTALGQIAAWNHLTVDSAITLVKALSEVPAADLNRATLICAVQLTAELAEYHFGSGQDSLKERTAFAKRLRDQNLSPAMELRLMADQRSGTVVSRAKRTYACIAWSRGVALSNIESALTGRPSAFHRPRQAGPVRQAAQRAADFITAVIEVARYVHRENLTPDILDRLDDLAVALPGELEFGIPGGLLPLAQRMDLELERDGFAALASRGLTDATRILEADDEQLAAVTHDVGFLSSIRQAASELVAEGLDDAEVLPPPVD